MSMSKQNPRTTIITPTEAVKRELIERFQMNSDIVAVTLEAPRKVFQPMRKDETTEVKQRLGVADDFVLFVGTIEPRKNLSRLITAYGQLRRQTGLPHALVIAGKEGWLFQGIYEQVAREGLTECVLFSGFVADADLPALYTLADVLVGEVWLGSGQSNMDMAVKLYTSTVTKAYTPNKSGPPGDAPLAKLAAGTYPKLRLLRKNPNAQW